MAVPVPTPLPIGEALQRSEPLGLLRALLKQSNERYAVIAPLLPPALAPHVRPGPVGDDGWALLADNAAVAAKLRQLLPRLEAALAATPGQRSAIRIRVQSR